MARGACQPTRARRDAEARATGPVSPLFAGVCRYYHDCFSADSRGGVLNNVLDKNQAEYLVFADGDEALITGAGLPHGGPARAWA